MNQLDLLQREMGRIFRMSGDGETVRLVTHCLYPTNALVQVAIIGTGMTFSVSDDGGALKQITAAGVSIEHCDRLIKHILKPHGLLSYNGFIHAPPCSATDVPYWVCSVANASAEAAEWLFAHTRLRPTASFKEMVAHFLASAYAGRVDAETLVGHSNKPHRFDNVITFDSGKKLVVDAVTNDPSSINARVVANLDVRSAGLTNIEQRIVYDDAEPWSASSLNLLGVGATAVPFSKAPEVIGRFRRAA